MAFTTPRTWVTGETVTAAHLNEQLRDNMLAIRAAPYCSARAVGTQDIEYAVWTNIQFTSTIVDPLGWLSNSAGNPTLITPDTAGRYLVIATVAFTYNPTGVRAMTIAVNGIPGNAPDTEDIMVPASSQASYQTKLHLTKIVEVNGTTDTIEVGAWQSSGATIPTTDTGGSSLSVTWIGA